LGLPRLRVWASGIAIGADHTPTWVALQESAHGWRVVCRPELSRARGALVQIAIIQPYNKAVAAEEFQVWKLAVRPDRTATLTCDDGNGNIVFTKEIKYTDFPLDEITLYFTNKVIHLPSEY